MACRSRRPVRPSASVHRRLRLRRHIIVDGSIPACAGEPWQQQPGLYQSTVYPRVCGGTGSSYLCARFTRGLSPRVRGNLQTTRHKYARYGSIPACAGEPCRHTASTDRHRVYPRVCGGTAVARRYQVSPEGLSPRVRGNRPPGGGRIYLCGSIPACAGEPWAQRRPGRTAPVYPRVCGGTFGSYRFAVGSHGLSPRVRGNPSTRRHSPQDARSIPACAGEPFSARRADNSPQVYPRVCGGTLGAAPARAYSAGLSPRVRGNPACRYASGGAVGSIPACAGEPVRRAALHNNDGVYPRVCGGTLCQPSF